MDLHSLDSLRHRRGLVHARERPEVVGVGARADAKPARNALAVGSSQ